jgi:hypothetical protein
MDDHPTMACPLPGHCNGSVSAGARNLEGVSGGISLYHSISVLYQAVSFCHLLSRAVTWRDDSAHVQLSLCTKLADEAG